MLGKLKVEVLKIRHKDQINLYPLVVNQFITPISDVWAIWI